MVSSDDHNGDSTDDSDERNAAGNDDIVGNAAWWNNVNRAMAAAGHTEPIEDTEDNAVTEDTEDKNGHHREGSIAHSIRSVLGLGENSTVYGMPVRKNKCRTRVVLKNAIWKIIVSSVLFEGLLFLLNRTRWSRMDTVLDVTVYLSMLALCLIICFYAFIITCVPLWYAALFFSHDAVISRNDTYVPVMKSRWMSSRQYGSVFKVTQIIISRMLNIDSESYVTIYKMDGEHASVMIHGDGEMVSFIVDNNDIIMATISPMDLSEQSVMFIDYNSEAVESDGRVHSYDANLRARLS